MTHPDAEDRHERTAPANGLAPGVPIEVDGMTIAIDELWPCVTDDSRTLVAQITREMRQPVTLSPDSTDSYITGDTATD
jgi:hypothetical protein